MDLNLTDSSLKKKYIYVADLLGVADPMGTDRQILAQHACPWGDIDEGEENDFKYFYLHDRLGSVRLVINDSGNVVKYYTYEPFGELIEDAGTFDNAFRFTGQYFDAEIEEYYLWARQYNPQIARFTSRDPILGRPFEPLTLHKYLYALNDPIDSVDPSGEMAEAIAAPVTAGYATHALAIAIVTTAVSMQMDFDVPAGMADALMDIGLAFEKGIADVMAYVAVGLGIREAQAQAIKTQFPEKYPWGSKEDIEYLIYGHEQGMQGNPEFRGNDPKNKWRRILANILEFFENIGKK